MNRLALTAFAGFLALWASHVRAEETDRPSYLELGLTASTCIYPSIGYWWGRTGARFTGMYFGEDWHEYHVNFGYEIDDSGDVQHSVNLLTSWVVGSDPGADYRYAATGVAYALNYKGLFLELGLAVPWRDELGNLAGDPVVPCGYWGYMHRFK
jgi:hypothetical protein